MWRIAFIYFILLLLFLHLGTAGSNEMMGQAEVVIRMLSEEFNNS